MAVARVTRVARARPCSRRPDGETSCFPWRGRLSLLLASGSVSTAHRSAGGGCRTCSIFRRTIVAYHRYVSGDGAQPMSRREGSVTVAKQVKQLDRVIIRFAGDSGDGMQLTGDRFTQESAAFGNDLMTLPNFPAEIRAPQGTLPGVSSFQVHFADHDILTAGRLPRRAGGDESRCPEGQPARHATGQLADRGQPRLHQPQPDQGGVRRQPARGQLAGRLRAQRGGPDRHDRRGGQGVRAVPQGRRTREEHVRPRAALLDVRPPDRDHARVPGEAVRARHRTSATPTSRRSRPAGTSARRPRRSRCSTRSSRRRCRPAPTATSPATWRWPTAWSPAACSRGCRSSSAPTRSRRPPTSSTS